jgi:DNA polymerase-3 subunit delta
MSQVYLFTGENEYLLREERRKWKAQFIEKHGDQNYLMIQGNTTTFRQFLDEISVAPFLGDKRLIIIDGIPKFSKEEYETLPECIHPDCIVLFIDSKPDKRLGGVKALLKIAEIKQFSAVESSALRTWAMNYLKSKGSTIEMKALEELLLIVGENQDTLSQELLKLSLYKPSQMILLENVKALAVPSGEQEVWQLTRLLMAGDVQGALSTAADLLNRGEDAYSLWSILLWMLRSMVSVRACVESGIKNPAIIATEAGVPFPTVKTVLPNIGSVPFIKLQSLLNWAAQSDIDLKTGLYKSTTDSMQEINALIDRFILRCSILSPQL